MQESVIFKAAVKLPPDERVAYLDQACGADAALRLEVEGLLRANDQPGEFMQRPPIADMTTTLGPGPERPGMRVGPYKLLQFLGEGGMGTVFLAEQSEPVRRMVALKIIKPGMDSSQVLARFEAERQALALMDHPNIARVLEAGETPPAYAGGSPRPYFVMELVKGVPITEFCDKNKLTTRQRLELFIPVCHAIQHAHMKGIIHRDVKPSNVLIALYDGKPAPKVIDFGVAKAMAEPLTKRTLFTQVGQIVGTFEYMSPEQATLNQLDIDTRSDVYSLGVLLYELLTGVTPLDKERLRQLALDQMLQTIREEEPLRPSARLSSEAGALAAAAAYRGTDSARLAGVLRGELDWIVMKCLEKERDRRFVTAGNLAQDVERYLRDEPVTACPPTVGYRLRKFARKHRKLLATVAAFAVLLLLGVAASTWQAVRATQAEAVANENAVRAQDKEQEAKKERDDAQRQRDDVKALNEKLREAQAELRRTLYAAHINLAQQAWDKGGAERTHHLLEQHRPRPGETDLRGFEWYYLFRLSHADLVTVIKGHTDTVRAVAYSLDGKRLASVSNDNTVKLWDALTGKELLTLQGHTSAVSAVAFSPDGKRLASASWGMLKLWDVANGQEVLTLTGRQTGGVNGLAYSPNGKHLASVSGDGTVRVWDALTGKNLLTLNGHNSTGSAVAFSPDGKRLASGSFDQTVKLWDVATGQEVRTLKGHAGGVRSLAFSPDGQRLASTSNDQTVKVWDPKIGKELLTLKGHTGNVLGVAFSPDGKHLASASVDRTVKVWDAQTGNEIRSLKGHTDTVWDVAFSPTGQRLASVSADHTVMVWEARPVERSLTLKPAKAPDPKRGPVPVSSVAFGPDGKHLFTQGSGPGAGGVTLWDAQTGKEFLTSDEDGLISPNGKHRATTFWDFSSAPERLGEVQMWDVETGQKLFTIKGHGLSADNKQAAMSHIAFSADGTRLARGTFGFFGGTSNELQVWDAKTGQDLLSIKGAGGIPVFSPDGKRLASVHPSGPVRVWDAQTGKELFTVKRCDRVSFSPDGKRLVSIDRDTVKVWDVRTGMELFVINGPVNERVKAAFSPDSKRLAIGGRVWDAETGKEMLTVKGHSGVVNSMVFSPDGKRLATAATDATVKVWDAQTGQELLTLEGHGGQVNGVAFSPDGHRLASGAADGTVKIWDATPLPENP